MAVVSVAIVLSFHLKNEPSDFELRMAKPLGIVFWILAVSCLFLGVGNYISRWLQHHEEGSADRLIRNGREIQQKGCHCTDGVEDTDGLCYSSSSNACNR